MFDQKEQCAKHPTPVAVHHGKFFKRILPLLPWRLSGVRSSAAPWEGIDGECLGLELQEDTGPSDSSMRFITSDTDTSPSMRTPQSLSVLEFLFSYGGSKVQGWSLVFFLLPSLKWLIKMKRDCLLSAFWQPWQNCSSNFITFWVPASSPI